MSKYFIVCDPNIVGTGGHYLEYAKMVIGGAEARGFRPVLAVNATCDVAAPAGWTILPVFTYGFWGRRLGTEPEPNPSMTPADRKFLRAKYSNRGLLWNAAADLGEVRHFNRDYPLGTATVRRVRALHEARFMSDLFLKAQRLEEDGEAEAGAGTSTARARAYAAQRAAIKAALATLDARAGGDRRMTAMLARVASDAADVTMDYGALEDLTSAARRSDSFSDGLGHVFDEIRPGEDSLVLYPTINYFELRGLKERLHRQPAARVPSHHIVLRRNVYSGYPSSFDEQEWAIHPMRTALALLNAVGRDTRMRFYTDTKPLTDQYDLLSAQRFTTGPVPIDMVERGAIDFDRPRIESGSVLLLVDVDAVAEARAFVDGLTGAPPRIDGRVDLRFVVRGAAPLGTYLAAGLSGPHPFGTVAFLLPEDLDAVATGAHDAVVLGTWHAGYTRLATACFERGVPIGVPFASWLAEAINRRSAPYHDTVLAEFEPVARVEHRDLSWTHYDFASDLQYPAIDPNRIVVKPGAGTNVELEVPGNVDTVRLRFDQSDVRSWRQAVNIIAFFRPHHDRSRIVGRHDSVLTTDGVTSLVLPVPPEAVTFAVSLCNFTTPASLPLTSLRVDWYACGRLVPALPGGLIMPTLSNDFAHSWVRPLEILFAARGAYDRPAVTAMDPVDLRRVVPVGQRPMVASYLGDARAEKGFDRLPALVRALLDPSEPNDVLLKAQVYFTSSYPEPACVAAAAILRTVSRDRVILIERALESREYAREILTSDAVLIPYESHEYIARSSGIFAEALGAGVPVVVPSGTWMSAELQAFSYRQHVSQIPSEALIAVETLDLYVLRGGTSSPLPTVRGRDVVPVARGVIHFVHMAVPENVAYVWLRYSPDPDHPDVHTRFDIAFQDVFPSGGEIAKLKRVVGGGIAAVHSLLVRVPPQAAGIWIGIYNAFDFTAYQLRRFSLSFVRSGGPRLPETAGGVVYFTGDDRPELDGNLADAVRHLAREYDVYAASAAALRAEWAERNAPTRLLHLMEAPFAEDAGDDRARFQGCDW